MVTNYYQNPPTVLASSSPRRQELLKNLMIPFSIFVPQVDESNLPSELPRDYVHRVATLKGNTAIKKYSPAHVIIAADTVVALGDLILGKPNDENHAFEILSQLSGTTHQVFTGLFVAAAEKVKVLVVESKVEFKELSAEAIRSYVATKDPLDKAGAYGIQGEGKEFVKSLQGSISNVMGLPLRELSQVLVNDFSMQIF